jgi:hypothetical protein
MGFAVQARPGDPDHLYPGQLQVLLTKAVALECLARAVGLEGVEFDRESMLWPVDVQLKSQLVEVGAGPGQPGADHKLEEPLLNVGAAEGGGPVEGQRTSESAGAMMTGIARQHRFDRVEVEQPQLFGAFDHSSQPSGVPAAEHDGVE